tara:strand:+ start:928 stop:1224 length:297 start_codon:yes stop_codon:yes gene_type:complete
MDQIQYFQLLHQQVVEVTQVDLVVVDQVVEVQVLMVHQETLADLQYQKVIVVVMEVVHLGLLVLTTKVVVEVVEPQQMVVIQHLKMVEQVEQEHQTIF